VAHGVAIRHRTGSRRIREHVVPPQLHPNGLEHELRDARVVRGRELAAVADCSVSDLLRQLLSVTRQGTRSVLIHVLPPFLWLIEGTFDLRRRQDGGHSGSNVSGASCPECVASLVIAVWPTSERARALVLVSTSHFFRLAVDRKGHEVASR